MVVREALIYLVTKQRQQQQQQQQQVTYYCLAVHNGCVGWLLVSLLSLGFFGFGFLDRCNNCVDFIVGQEAHFLATSYNSNLNVLVRFNNLSVGGLFG
jgi:hypothetical protein